MVKTKHSFKDKNGALWVACSECNRGGNGDQSCSCGWKCKKFNNTGCFIGKLLPKFTNILDWKEALKIK